MSNKHEGQDTVWRTILMPRQKSAKSYEFQTVLVLSLKLHYRRHWEAVVGNLMEVVLGQTVRSYGHPQGGRREVIPHHWRWEGSERPDGTVKLVLQRGVVLLLQRPSFFSSPVLEPNLNLKTIKHYNSVSDDFSAVHTCLSDRPIMLASSAFLLIVM